MTDTAIFLPADELIKRGMLDITSLEAAENDQDKLRREAEPNAYVLTYNEAVTLNRAYNIFDAVALQKNAVTVDSTTRQRVTTIDDSLKEAVKASITEHGIDLASLQSLVDRVYEGNFYTLELSSKYYPSPDKVGFHLVAQIDGHRQSGILTIEDFPIVYEPDHSRTEEREALGLPANVRFLYSGEHSIVTILRTVFCDDFIEKEREFLTNRKPGLPESLLQEKFFPMLNGPMVTDIMQLSVSRMERDDSTETAFFVTKNGHELRIEKFDDLLGALSVSAKKILNHAILYLKNANYYRGHAASIIPTVEIPLDEYRSLTRPGQTDTPESMKEFKKSIRRDLHDISALLWSAEETKGRNRGNYAEMRIISSHSIRRGNILRINFDVDAAAYLLNSYLMQYPRALYTYDERKPNAFSIAYKIALHNSMDTNVARGTESTLSVASLLDAAPEIPTYEQMTASGNRNWKGRIKGTLEKAINESISKGFLQRWEYRSPKTGTTYTPDQANTLTYIQWRGLMVDYVVIDAPDQTQRREAIAAARRIAAEAKAAEPPKRKRGRPRKTQNDE